MRKTVLIIHGWPQPVGEKDLIYRYFGQKGYRVCCPYLFKMRGKFSLAGAKEVLEVSLKGRKPEVIVGISMGGLIVPILAMDYPDSKLVFVASGTCFSPDHWLTRLGWRWCGRGVVRLVKKMSEKWLLWFYHLVNPNRCRKGGGQSDVELRDNLEKVLTLSDDRIVEVLTTLGQIDNTKLLKTLKNKAIIFSGDRDVMMPAEQGGNLNRLMKNSRLEIISGKHHDLVGEEMFKMLDGFLD